MPDLQDRGLLYRDLLKQGPFPGTIDPWAEAGRYFRPLHNQLIAALLNQLQDPLLDMGYIVGRETSLQIAEGRQPDLYVEHARTGGRHQTPWNYTVAAEEVLASAGVVIGEDSDLDALHIRRQADHDLVTVIELVSPTNKEDNSDIPAYRARRERVVVDQGVNVVEVDLTRSVKRWFDHPQAARFAYHVAVHLSDQLPRLIGIAYGEPLSRIAIPLRAAVIPVNLQAIYSDAYGQTALAGHILKEGRYLEAQLPFPSLLTGHQRREALAAVERWRHALGALA